MSKAWMMAAMANRQRGRNGRRVGVEYEDRGFRDAMDGYGRSEYQVEQRFRDRDGREHYDNGRFAPQSNGRRNWPESRREEYAEPMARYPGREMPRSWHDPYRFGGEPLMPMIGFSGGDGFRQDAGMDASYPARDEISYRRGMATAGHSQGAAVMPMDRQRAEQWVSGMQNADGTQGPHWSMEQTEQVRTQQGIQCDPVKFWVAMNMMYSDYCKVGEKMGVNNAAFYACLAKAFLEDQDAQPEKLARYYEYIARH